ncbi:MAG TPA: hypothetical protein DCL40_02180 [Coxiellaceae bacterium]|nr:hypothetical protein [Coxiellaceae bacterium]
MGILVTGCAGFIGHATCLALLNQGKNVIGIDNLNDYYAVTLKQDRLDQLVKHKDFSFHRIDIADYEALDAVFENNDITTVIHLAAQAGVRYSIDNPSAYVQSNLVGFGNILETCRHHTVEHLIFASSSSVYGANTTYPFKETDNVDHPMSFYAATKKSNELMAHTYSSLYQLPCTGLRFFTVYGPWGRPDMAPMIFANKIHKEQPIDVYNHGDMVRDFTFIDDIVDGIIKSSNNIPNRDPNWSGISPNPATSYAPYRIYNIGNGSPEKLMDFIEALEHELGKQAIINYLPIQPGDVPKTAADIDHLANDCAYQPSTRIQEGVKRFIAWYKAYYSI